MNKRKSIIIVITVLLIAAMATSMYLGNSIDSIQSAIRDVVDGLGIWGPLLYTLLYILLGLTGFSVTIMTLVAIGIFDSLTAFLVVVIGATVSAVVAFYLARRSNYDYNSMPTTAHSARKLVAQLAKRIESNVSRRPFISTLLLRFAQPPYIAFSYAAGLARTLPLLPFAAATAVANSVSTAAYVLIGAIVIRYFAVAAIVGLAVWVTYRIVVRQRSRPAAAKT
jgi:uncharacterized membrane protein YdjX (TVP38/TMEM64 family)